VLRLKDIPQGTKVFNIESNPGNGGKYLRSAGCFATVMNKEGDIVEIQIKRKILKLNKECRAIIGVAAGDGRLIKPFVKAGNKHYLMKSKGRKWHFTSAIKVNAVDHPFGSGRGKRPKSKIAQRNAPPGKKVGHIRPRRTGWIR
jgi:large subunit ribosomal protein L2